MKAWRVHRYGRPSDALRLDEVDPPEPGPGQLRVRVSHSVLNFNDIDGCHGRYRTVNPPLPYTAGMEVTGTVDAAGPGAEAWIGRRVVACPDGAMGGHAEQAVAPIDLSFEAPPTLEGREAAAFFFPFHLSWLSLHERARLQPGESVLVHAAAGGVGSAAVQLAKAAGATVFTTSGGPEKTAFCGELGAACAIDYRSEDFAEAVLEATDGEGVDVVFDTVGGEVAEKSWRCIARNGRHLMVGFSGGIEAEDSGITPRPIIFGNFSLLGVILAYTSTPREIKRATGWNFVPRRVGEEIHARLLELLDEKRIRPVIGSTVRFEELPAALEALEERRTIGRTVVAVILGRVGLESGDLRIARRTGARSMGSTHTPEIQDWVIDADTHISEPGDLWTSRLAAKYRDVAPRIVRDPESQVETWRISPDADAFLPVGFTALAGWPEPFPAAPRNMDEVPKGAYDASARLEYMDRVGIWAMALYPNVGGFGSQAFLKMKDPELMLACVRAYNDFLIDWISPDPRRFIPILATPFWDVEASVAEIERCAKLGHKGVLFTGEPQSHGMPVLGNRHWDPLWTAARDCDLPVSFHIGAGTFDDGFTPERFEAQGAGQINGFTAVSLFLDNGKQITDLLFSGILPRFPELKFVSVESGVGFIPFILEACDYTFEYGQVRRSNPEFELKPSEYFARQVYGCYIFEEHAPRELMSAIGEDNIMFETDYPHPVCLYGNVREKIDAALGNASEAARRKVLFENAAKLYKVDAPDVPPPVPVG